MRLTITQARALGIPESYLTFAAQAERSEAVRERLEIAPVKPADGMNKLERSFSETLMVAESRGLIRGWRREPLSFRLAGRTFYRPDFMVYVWDDLKPLTFVEVKGVWRDDAAVKTKVAAEQYDWFRWLVVYREKPDAWRVFEVDRTGIGRSPIMVPWIGG